MHRFFIPPEWIDGERVTIEGPAAHQIRDVLRLERGDCIAILDDSGWEYEVALESMARGRAQGSICARREVTEPSVKITLYQALLKGSKQDFILQKCTELGVSAFAPMLCHRCVASHPSQRKLARWSRIIAEAAEQSGRGRLPELETPMSFEEACRSVDGLSLLCQEGEGSIGLRQALDSKPLSTVNLFVGPEGGFSPAEVELALGCGIAPVNLGPRVFRAETAGLVAAAAILYECGELDPI